MSTALEIAVMILAIVSIGALIIIMLAVTVAIIYPIVADIVEIICERMERNKE